MLQSINKIAIRLDISETLQQAYGVNIFVPKAGREIVTYIIKEMESMINLFEYIKENKKLNTLLMHECDIYFYKESKETNFSSNQEVYSIPCEAFAQDGSGGEFVFLNDCRELRGTYDFFAPQRKYF